MKTILTSGAELEAKRATQGSGYIQGAQRETLMLELDGETMTVEALDAAMTEEECERIKVCGDGCEYVYHGYTVRGGLQLTPRGDGGRALTVTVARRTEQETQVAALVAGQTALQDAVDVLTLDALGIIEEPDTPIAPSIEPEPPVEGGEEVQGNV